MHLLRGAQRKGVERNHGKTKKGLDRQLQEPRERWEGRGNEVASDPGPLWLLPTFPSLTERAGMAVRNYPTKWRKEKRKGHAPDRHFGVFYSDSFLTLGLMWNVVVGSRKSSYVQHVLRFCFRLRNRACFTKGSQSTRVEFHSHKLYRRLFFFWLTFILKCVIRSLVCLLTCWSDCLRSNLS